MAKLKNSSKNGIVEVLRASVKVKSQFMMSVEDRKKLSEAKASIIKQANEFYPVNKRSKLFETVQTLQVSREQRYRYAMTRDIKDKPYTYEIHLKMNIYEEEM